MHNAFCILFFHGFYPVEPRFTGYMYAYMYMLCTYIHIHAYLLRGLSLSRDKKLSCLHARTLLTKCSYCLKGSYCSKRGTHSSYFHTAFVPDSLSVSLSDCLAFCLSVCLSVCSRNGVCESSRSLPQVWFLTSRQLER
jgi:hypothetical protein